MKHLLTITLALAVAALSLSANDLRRLQDAAFEYLGVTTGSDNSVEQWKADLKTSFEAVAKARQAHVEGQIAKGGVPFVVKTRGGLS